MASARYLRCNSMEEPLGLEDRRPVLSWEFAGGARGDMQSAYRIIAAGNGKDLAEDRGTLWDSGKVGSGATGQVEYAGESLAPFTRVFWKVKVWDKKGNASPWSKPASWTMGIIDQSLWKGKWIAYPVGAIRNAIWFRKNLRVRKKVERALVHATAKGIYELYLNGRRIGEDFFTPGWTDYHKRIYYNTYDVTSMLRKGKNAIGSILGEGWYKGPIGFKGSQHVYGASIYLLLNLRIEYSDGSVETLATDGSWKCSTGPISKSTFLEGESYDARLELPGCFRWSYDDSGWRRVLAVDLEAKRWDNATMAEVPLTSTLQAYPGVPVRKTEYIRTQSIWKSPSGSWIFDFGQNFAGIVRLKVKGRKGTVLRIRYGEMANPDGSLYVENLRSAVSTDTYILRGGGKAETWEAKFTFHGFRYTEITGLAKKPGQNTLTGIVLGSDTERAGEFSCGVDMINMLYRNITWTQRANFLEVPTDCPQRDERLGWTGDAQVYIRTATYNMDVHTFFRKWLVDLEDTQNAAGAVANVAPQATFGGEADAAWGDVAIICPMTLYRVYGDRRVLEKHYPMMKAWVEYLKSTSKNCLRGSTHCFGDWLSIDAHTPKPLIQTAFFAYVSGLLSEAAGILGKEDEEVGYAELSKRVKSAFQKEYVCKNGRIKGDTQTAYVLALHFDLLSEGARRKAVKHLVDRIRAREGHLSTGFVGTPYLPYVLSRNGHADLAYKLLLNRTYPSWGYSVMNGATTIWERWNGWKKGEGCADANMKSFSHYAYGAIGEWLFSTVCGLDLLEPGFKSFRIAPVPDMRMKHAGISYRSPTGLIRTSWKWEKDSFAMFVDVPANTVSEINVPCSDPGSVVYNPSKGKDASNMRLLESREGGVVFEITGNGAFSFESRLTDPNAK